MLAGEQKRAVAEEARLGEGVTGAERNAGLMQEADKTWSVTLEPYSQTLRCPNKHI